MTTYLLSLRSTHSSPLLPVFVLALLQKIEQEYPKLPIYVCFEFDSAFDLTSLIAGLEDAELRYQGAAIDLIQGGRLHDQMLLKLLRFIQSQGYPFMNTDLKGINDIPFLKPW